MMSQLIFDQSIVAVRPENISSNLGGEAVILQLETGQYYGLDGIGSRIWNLIQQPTSLSQIRSQLLSEYDVQPDDCDRELLALLQQLQSEGLIDIQNEASA